MNELAAAKGRLDQLHGRRADESSARGRSHAGFLDRISKERMDYLENVLGESADEREKHTKELEAAKAARLKLTADQMLDYIEPSIDDSAEMHAAELSGAALSTRTARAVAQSTRDTELSGTTLSIRMASR